MKKATLPSCTIARRSKLDSPRVTRLILNFCTLIAAFSLGLQTASPQVTFDPSEGYPTAPAGFTPSGSAVNSSTTAIAFGSGNAEGWTLSSSTATGLVVSATSSGSFAGDQALGTGTTSSGQTYIGALNLGLNGISSFTFDVYDSVGISAQATVGGYYNAGSDGQFHQSADTGVVGGILSDEQFGIRGANFGTAYGSGVAPTLNNWYQLTLTYNYVANSATLSAFDLTTSSAVNLGGSGGNFTETIGSLYGATANPANYEGVVVRVTADGELDVVSANAVPEPSSVALMVGGLCVLLGVHRSRKLRPA